MATDDQRRECTVDCSGVGVVKASLLKYCADICFAKDKDIVNGFADGEFKPGNPVSHGATLKIILGVFGMTVQEPLCHDLWQEPYYRAARALFQTSFENINADTFSYGGNTTRALSVHWIRNAYDNRSNVAQWVDKKT